jgi:hypothetical protein
MIKQDTISFPDTFDTPNSLPTLLQHDSLFMADRTTGGGNDQWPNCKTSPRFRHIVSTLVSFGPVHLNIVTLNVENITRSPARIADLDQIEDLNSMLHLTFTAEYTAMLYLDGDTYQVLRSHQ